MMNIGKLILFELLIVTMLVSGITFGVVYATHAKAFTAAREAELREAHQRVNQLTVNFDVAMENSNRLRANLSAMRDFADDLEYRVIGLEAQAIARGYTPGGHVPGWPTMQSMVRACQWTNDAGALVIQIKEAR